MKDIDLCKRLEKDVAESNEKATPDKKKAKTKVTTEEVKEYNRQLIAGREGGDCRLEQVYRHKRLQQMMGDALFITSSGRSLKPVSGATWETSRTQPYQAITISQYLEASFDDDENIDWQSAHGHLPETTAAIPEVL